MGRRKRNAKTGDAGIVLNTFNEALVKEEDQKSIVLDAVEPSIVQPKTEPTLQPKEASKPQAAVPDFQLSDEEPEPDFEEPPPKRKKRVVKPVRYVFGLPLPSPDVAHRNLDYGKI